MRHAKTARPTLRLLKEDLPERWTDVNDRRAAFAGHWNDLHPFASVGHPVIAKCAEYLGDDPSDDMTTQVIACSGNLRLTEVGAGQWRAGVWTDPDTGVRWILAAGLAKGDHKDHDDFYEKLKARVARDNGDSLKPTEDDQKLLKKESIARALLNWELELQSMAAELLAEALDGETQRQSIPHPLGKEDIGQVEIIYSSYDGCEDLVIEFLLADSYRGGDIGWTATTCILNALWPPEQDWDRVHDSHSILLEENSLSVHLKVLQEENRQERLVAGRRGDNSHYTHEKHLTDRTIQGSSVRSLCGVFFVPMQDHNKLPTCPTCTEVRERLNREVARS